MHLVSLAGAHSERGKGAALVFPQQGAQAVLPGGHAIESFSGEAVDPTVGETIGRTKGETLG
jgi:hypothetical protein